MRILLTLAITACAAAPAGPGTTTATLELPGSAAVDVSAYVATLCGGGIGTIVFVSDPSGTPCDQASPPIVQLSLQPPFASDCGGVCCSTLAETPPAVGGWTLDDGTVQDSGTTGVALTELDEAVVAGRFTAPVEGGIAGGTFAAPRCE